jgi:hypothetical protein
MVKLNIILNPRYIQVILLLVKSKTFFVQIVVLTVSSV